MSASDGAEIEAHTARSAVGDGRARTRRSRDASESVTRPPSESRPTEASDPHASDAGERASLGGLVRAGLAFAIAWTALFALRECVAEEPGEPWVLRWLRIASEHPVRCSLAVVLATLALSSPTERARAPAEFEPGGSGSRKNS